jgi:hypothetical protein
VYQTVPAYAADVRRHASGEMVKGKGS